MAFPEVSPHMLEEFSLAADTDFLPALMRKLLKKAGAGDLIAFGEGIAKYQRGYDGKYSMGQATALPAGVVSVELHSGGKTPASDKFTKDFVKRNADADLVFFAVNLTSWSDYIKWRDEKRALGKFKDVIVWSATELADEINRCPEIALWALKRMNRAHGDFITAESWAESILERYQTVPPTAFALGGYESEVAAVTEFLTTESKGRVTGLTAESRSHAELALAQILASISGYATTNLIFSYAAEGSIGVPTPANTKLITDAARDSVLVKTAAANRIDVLTLFEEDEGPAIRFRKRRLGILEQVLENAGVKDHHDVARAVHAGVSHALKTLYGLAPPPRKWLILSNSLAGFALVGSLSPDYETDSKIAGELFGDWGNLQSQLKDCVNRDNPLVEHSEGAYRVRNGHDALETISKAINDTVLGRFEKHFEEVLRSQGSKQIFLKREGLRPGPSDRLLANSCRMVAQLANTDLEINAGGQRNVVAYAKNLVRAAIQHSSDKWYMRRLAGFLPVLVQANPDEVLKWIEQQCDSDPHFYLGEVDENGPFGSWQPYVYILWALEKAAWHPDHVATSVRILAKLAQLPEPPQSGNTAFGSLLGIFRPWVPGTVISQVDRFKLIDATWSIAPEVWARLCKALLPTDDIGSYNSEPEFWSYGRESIEQPTDHDVRTAWEEFFNRYLETIKDRPVELVQLLHDTGIPALSPGYNGKIIEQIRSKDWSKCSDEEKLEVKKKLEEVAAYASYFDERVEALEPAQFAALKAISESLEFSDDQLEARLLFDRMTPSRRFGRDWETAKKLLEIEQNAAVATILKGSDDEVIAFAQSVDEPGLFMSFVGKVCAIERTQTLVNRVLEIDDERRESMMYALLSGRNLIGHAESRVSLGSPPPVWAAALKVALMPSVGELVAAIEEADEAVKHQYWRGWGRTFVLDVSAERLTWVVSQFMKYGKVADALQTIAYHLPKAHDPALVPLILRAIEAGIEAAKAGDKWSLDSYHLNELLKYCLIETAPEVTHSVAQAELFLSAVLSYGYNYPGLSRAAALEPRLVIELASLIYRNDEGEVTHEGDYSNLYGVLNSLVVLPGQVDGQIDADLLVEFARSLREIAVAERRTKAFGIVFGQWLGRNRLKDPDGLWPHRGVRFVIEECADQILEQHVVVGRLNSRGMQGISRTDPGGPERETAREMRTAATLMALEFPRTAAVLRSIAERFESQAERWERHVEDRD